MHIPRQESCTGHRPVTLTTFLHWNVTIQWFVCDFVTLLWTPHYKVQLRVTMQDINVWVAVVQTEEKEGNSVVWPFQHAFVTPHQTGVSGHPHAPSVFAAEQELPVLNRRSGGSQSFSARFGEDKNEHPHQESPIPRAAPSLLTIPRSSLDMCRVLCSYNYQWCYISEQEHHKCIYECIMMAGQIRLFRTLNMSWPPNCHRL